MPNDPKDNGGLFIGRGKDPALDDLIPVNSQKCLRDRWLGYGVLAIIISVNITFWGPVEIGWLWIVSLILAEHLFLALVSAFIGIILTLFLWLFVCHQLDGIWISLRRSSGVDQRVGAMTRVFFYTAMVGTSLFLLWLIFGGGLASSGTLY